MLRMWTLAALGFLGCALLSCDPAKPAEAPPRAAPAPAPVVGEPVDPAVTPTFGRLARIQITENNQAASIDEAGNVRIGTSPLFVGDLLAEIGLPFSQPVEEVLFVRHVATANVPGAPMGIVVCARTRAATLECLTDYAKTEQDGRRVRVAAYRFALGRGRVTHIATARPPSEPYVCARYEAAAQTSAKGECWLFAHDGKQAVPYTFDAASAATVATGLSPALVDAWKRAERDFDVARVRKRVASEGRDQSRILGAASSASIAVSCALLDSGVLSCFGPGVYGELGDGKLDTTARASRPLGTAAVIDVAMHGHYACAVVADGRLACWGELPESLPVARTGPKTDLPMCPLDRDASLAQFNEARQRIADEARACSARCKANPVRDCMLNCAKRCNRAPYVFRHDTICQEPLDLEQLIAPRWGDGCVSEQQTPQWLSDADLRSNTPKVGLTLAPVYVNGVSDAIAVAVWGPRVCVVRRDGRLQCLQP